MFEYNQEELLFTFLSTSIMDSQINFVVETLEENNLFYEYDGVFRRKEDYQIEEQKHLNYSYILDKHKKKISMNNKTVYRCTYIGCKKLYKSKENLTLHIMNYHLHLKPYKCSFCEKRFSHRNGKNYHERTSHTKELLYKCQDMHCSLAFPSQSAMISHYKSLHLHIK